MLKRSEKGNKMDGISDDPRTLLLQICSYYLILHHMPTGRYWGQYIIMSSKKLQDLSKIQFSSVLFKALMNT